MGDPYLMKRLKACVLLSPPPYDWAMLVLKMMIGDESKMVVYKLRNAASELLIMHPKLASSYGPDFIANLVLRKVI